MDFLVTALSTFFGAAVALASDRLLRWRDARLKEEAAVNNLILDLAAKRAFIVNDDWAWAAGEMERVVSSVDHVRQLVRDTRITLTPRSKALPAIRDMARSCNTFVELSEREGDDRMKLALKTLTSELAGEVQALHLLRPKRIVEDAPGSFALRS